MTKREKTGTLEKSYDGSIRLDRNRMDQIVDEA